MNLFELKNWELQIQPEAYALGPFKVLIDRDKTKNKDIGIKELAYIFYMVDYKSDFINIIEEDERNEQVKKYVELPNNWKPDKKVIEALEFYKQRSSTISLLLLEDARIGISTLSKYMRSINFNEVDINEKTGEIRPKHDIKKFADTIKQIPAIVEALNTLEESVKKEQQAEKGLRGGRQKGLYVDSD
jgi:hypothetical protein